MIAWWQTNETRESHYRPITTEAPSPTERKKNEKEASRIYTDSFSQNHIVIDCFFLFRLSKSRNRDHNDRKVLLYCGILNSIFVYIRTVPYSSQVSSFWFCIRQGNFTLGFCKAILLFDEFRTAPLDIESWSVALLRKAFMAMLEISGCFLIFFLLILF